MDLGQAEGSVQGFAFIWGWLRVGGRLEPGSQTPELPSTWHHLGGLLHKGLGPLG